MRPNISYTEFKIKSKGFVVCRSWATSPLIFPFDKQIYNMNKMEELRRETFGENPLYTAHFINKNIQKIIKI